MLGCVSDAAAHLLQEPPPHGAGQQDVRSWNLERFNQSFQHRIPGKNTAPCPPCRSLVTPGSVPAASPSPHRGRSRRFQFQCDNLPHESSVSGVLPVTGFTRVVRPVPDKAPEYRLSRQLRDCSSCRNSSAFKSASEAKLNSGTRPW